MKKKCIKIVCLIYLVCIVLAAIFALTDVCMFERVYSDDFYFDMITLDSVIAGFAFTNIGLLLNVAGTEVIRKVDNTDIMKRKNDKLLASIIYCVAAMFASLPFIINIGQNIKNFFPQFVSEFLAEGLYLSIIILSVLGIIYFVQSIIDISNLLDEVYENKSNLTKEDIDKINVA